MPWYHGNWKFLPSTSCSFPQTGVVDVLDFLGDGVERQEQVLARVVRDPTLADREVDDVGRVAGGERRLEVVLEGRLMVFPVDLDARVGALEAGDRVLDVLIEGRREEERPEADLGVRLDVRDDRLGRIDRERARRPPTRPAPKPRPLRWAPCLRQPAMPARSPTGTTVAALQAPMARTAIKANARVRLVCITPP